MRKTIPQKLVIDLLPRSCVNVQVAAVLEDGYGIYSWGWNGLGTDGMGMCAERLAIKRANRKRLRGSTLYVGGRWKKSGNWVQAIPCGACMVALRKAGITTIIHSTKDGKWNVING